MKQAITLIIAVLALSLLLGFSKEATQKTELIKDLQKEGLVIYPQPQGLAHIIKPLDDGKFEVLGSIKPNAW